ncbi:MAG: hypothetical protein ACLP59_05990 [Bryobacteraceae bacterium]
MSGFLLDTNVPSELTRQKSAPQVERWLEKANDRELYFCVIFLGEILKGSLCYRRASVATVTGGIRPSNQGRQIPSSHYCKTAGSRSMRTFGNKRQSEP